MFGHQVSNQNKEIVNTSISTTLANPFSYVLKSLFFTKGKGIHKDHLTSFELALRNAKISDLNLVTVSSIKPPGCKIVSIHEGRSHLVPGQIVFAIIARSSTNEPNRLIAASVGLARHLQYLLFICISCQHDYRQ
jgi:arginine decarboxylase